LALTTRLLEIRRTYPDFTDPRFDQGRALSDDQEGWLLLERGDMIMAINFADQPTEVWVGRELEVLLILGEVEIRDETVHLGRHSALAAQALS
jgi:maltooligosyltrehalose trehalohydrolase